MAETEFGELIDPQPYLEALPGFVDQLPPGARDFAENPDHYDFYSERCIKDLKLCDVSYADGGVEGIRLTLDFRFNELGVADELEVEFIDLRTVDWGVSETAPHGPTRLGDLILDELLPHAHGVSHELVFRGGTIRITAKDLVATWRRPESAGFESGIQPHSGG